MSDWAKEPWQLCNDGFIRCGDGLILATLSRSQEEITASLKREVECVNGCKGIIKPTTTVPELVAVLETVRVATVLHENRLHVTVQLSTATIAEIEAVLAKTGTRKG